jgi:glycosyltransferase involved in cell wall biosynthesis
MVILQLVTKRQYRGAEVFAASLSSMLASNGHKVIFTGLYRAPEHVLTAKGAINIDLNGKKSAFSLSLLLHLIQLIRKEKPDIIQANGSDTLKYAVLAKLSNPDLKIIYRNISMVSAWSKQASFKQRFNRWLFTRVDAVTSVGQEALDDLIRTYRYPVSKAKLIRRGIPEVDADRNLFKQKIAVLFRFDAANPLLMHIGQFSAEKNHSFLIVSMRLLLKKMPQIKLVFIGEGQLFESTKSFVKQEGLDGSIFFAGHRENVQEWLSAADLFLMGSTIEGVPGVVLEAGMQSVPCVAVKVGGVGEVVKNNETGILLPTHDPESFSEAIYGLMLDENTRNRYGANAKQFVKSNYSLQQCLKHFESLYQMILTEKNT